MRIHLSLTPNTTTVPFDYQQNLIGAFHKWLGKNNVHDNVSLYSLSWLTGSEKLKNGFTFSQGPKWFISSWDLGLTKKIVSGILEDPDVCFGMKVSDIQIQENPAFSCRTRFMLASPVLIRKYTEDNAIHLTYSDKDSDEYMTKALKTKLQKAGLDYNVNVKFDRNYSKPRLKLVTINGIHNRASLCPVIVEGDAEAIAFAWNVGLGHSTGCGFGALC